ncbi:hypothetical protein [Sphingobacterium sp. UBA1498]|uniref:hypothetical protein n=1 Tax=Sphingobacterium sp. UBA1498 TaxID=1947481 RepID=UPI0025F3B4B6|nr:hypothetical protein [Sphingobacterium sp. UBA1498]
MLDFYTIADYQMKPDFPEKIGLEFAGQLDFKTLNRLQQKGIIAQQFDYHTDFRLDTVMTKQTLQLISDKRLEMDADVKRLTPILDLANSKQSGLVAYSD